VWQRLRQLQETGLRYMGKKILRADGQTPLLELANNIFLSFKLSPTYP
jgi:hypothetical protein